MAAKITPQDELVTIARRVYHDTFNSEPDIISFAPGRVNLIGEHIDYNDGFVLPMALPMGTLFVGARNGTKSTADIFTLCENADKPNRVKFDVNNLVPGQPTWLNYVKGVIHCFKKTIPGFNAVIITNVPVGGGLSSSAALEVSTLTFLEAIAGETVSNLKDKALICQQAEHQFAGMPCGIMDQLISVMGEEKRALLIDCLSIDVKQIPFQSNELSILICNSNVRHELSTSEYSTRRKQCKAALELIGLKSYRDANFSHLEVITDPVLLSRARHVITEINRTKDAAEALACNDFQTFGKLMFESHASLRDDYEVSCKELDVLVKSASSCKGVLGSRMTGGGFGGCTVTLVENKSIDDVMKLMTQEYQSNGYGCPTFYICKPSKGACLINLG